MGSLQNYISHLSKDKVLGSFISQYGPLDPILPSKNIFEDIVDSIVSQQLSVKAANTIFTRFKNLFDDKFPTPDKILSISDEDIRNCGISYSKIKYIKLLSQAIVDKTFIPEKLFNLSDSEVKVKLIALKGIGEWTAEMILIFSLGREDIFSMGDIGLRNAVAKLYGVNRDDLEKIKQISEVWSPYRSYASRYLWKSLDNEPKVNI
jgi:DNA-3-methyladenine glycosylase II